MILKGNLLKNTYYIIIYTTIQKLKDKIAQSKSK